METLPINLLYHHSRVGMTYLASLEKAGYRPERILDLRFPPTSPAYAALGNIIGARRSKDLFRWRHKKQVTPTAHRAVADQFLKDLPHAALPQDRIRLRDYADEVDCLHLRDLGDPSLVNWLESQSTRTCIFTGNGIVPKNVFEVSRLRLLHVHTGALPAVRGSECLFWSMLLQGNPSATCFVMGPSLDQGAILWVEDVPRPQIAIPASGDHEAETLSLMASTYDYALRAHTLVRTIHENPSLEEEEPTVEGRMYYRMHPELKRRAIQQVMLPAGVEE